MLMSRFAKQLAYLTIVLMELCYIGMIGYGLHLVSQPNTAIAGAIIAGVFGFMFLIHNCILCCFWSKLPIAISVIGIAADFYASTKRLILVSLFYFVIHLLFFVLFAYSVLGLVSMNSFEWTDSYTIGKNGNKNYDGFTVVPGQMSQRKTFKDVNGSIGLIVVSFFIYTWIAMYIHNKIAFVTSVGASSYYFTSNANKDGSAEVMLGLKWSITKNFGSLCMGALIMTIVRMLRNAND